MEYLALIFSQTPENQVDNLRQALLALCADRNFEITWQTAWAYDFEENSLQISFSLKAEKPNLEALDTLALWQKATGNAKNQEIKWYADLSNPTWTNRKIGTGNHRTLLFVRQPDQRIKRNDQNLAFLLEGKPIKCRRKNAGNYKRGGGK